MYEYDYVKFKCKSTGWGGFAGVVYSIENYEVSSMIELKKVGDLQVLSHQNKEQLDIFKSLI